MQREIKMSNENDCETFYSWTEHSLENAFILLISFQWISAWAEIGQNWIVNEIQSRNILWWFSFTLFLASLFALIMQVLIASSLTSRTTELVDSTAVLFHVRCGRRSSIECKIRNEMKWMEARAQRTKSSSTASSSSSMERLSWVAKRMSCSRLHLI